MEATTGSARSILRDAEEQLEIARTALYKATSIVSRALYPVDELDKAKSLVNDIKSAREITRAARISATALAEEGEKRLEAITAQE